MLADVPDPVAGPGEVVAKVAAVGLNFLDTLIIAGKYQAKPPFPFSPGAEFAGVVESVGAGVPAIKPGDRVMGYTNYGAARERLAVAADKLVKLTAGLDFERAAALTITYGTGYHALKHRAQLKPARRWRCSALPAASGLAAVELGKHHGARVIACASTDDKLAFARAHGADETVNYATEDCAMRSSGSAASTASTWCTIRSAAPTAEPALRSLAWEGAIWWSDSRPARFRSCRSIWCCSRAALCSASIWGAWVRREPGRLPRGARPSSPNGAPRASSPATSSKVYPLAQTPQAIKALAERKAMGKLVVRP